MHPLFKCDVLLVLYDFEQHAGIARLAELHVPDMTGSIEFFERIDPEVVAIDCYSGESLDTGYRREGEKWEALDFASAGGRNGG